MNRTPNPARRQPMSEQMQERLFERMIGGGEKPDTSPTLGELVQAADHFARRAEANTNVSGRQKHQRRIAHITGMIDQRLGYVDQEDL
ncbi:hypothetical protein [Nesterenkonia suensis]